MKYAAILLCLCLLLVGCTAQSQGISEEQAVQESRLDAEGSEPSPAQPLTPESLESLLEITNARRQEIVKPAPDTSVVESWNMGDVTPPFDLETTRFDFVPEYSETDVYTLEQVQEDLDYLFYFYEIGYGPYFHFGGKEAFDAAKAAVLADLEELDDITAADLEASLIEHLSFVGDTHFVINHKYNHPMMVGYLSETAFLRDTEGYTEAASGKRVLSIAGQQDFAGDMVLSVTAGGDMVYRYLMLAHEQPGPVELALEDGETGTTALYSGHEAAGKPEESEEPVALSYVDEIPVINVTTMGFPHAHDDRGSLKFLELAEQLKDEPVLIIDLRANGGGNGLLPQMWYEAYTGSYITPNNYNLFRLDIYNALGYLGMSRSEPDPDSFYYIPADVTEYYVKSREINQSWELQNPEPREVIENDRLLIVLTSKNTASSADSFTDQTFNVENTLVIGGNTSGTFISAAAIGAKLPNSGMVGQMGFNLSVFDQDHFREGVGLMPDLWVDGDALEAAVALAKQRVQ